MTALRHQRRLEGVQQVATGRQVIRQRHQRVRTAGVDDNGGLRIAACLQQVKQLAPRLLKPGWRRIGGEHFRSQFQHHHQWIGRFLTGLLHPLPTRPEQRQNRQQPCHAQGDPRQLAVATTTAAEQGGVECRRQNHLPATSAFLPMPELPDQPAQQRQQQQPPRTEPVRPEGDHRRLRRRKRLRRSRQSGSGLCRYSSLLNRRCSGLSGHNSRATNSRLSHKVNARGQ